MCTSCRPTWRGWRPGCAAVRLWFDEDIVSGGLAQAPAALVGLFKGEAIGKRLVQVAPE
jgi:NADPH-dependent curcumin reductase CurA